MMPTEDARNYQTVPITMVAEHVRIPSKGIAAILSIVIPGLGHVYTGRVAAGFAWFVGIAVLWVMAIVSGLEFAVTADDPAVGSAGFVMWVAYPLIAQIVCIYRSMCGWPYQASHVSMAAVRRFEA